MSVAEEFCAGIWAAAGGTPEARGALGWTGQGDLPSFFAVTDLAAGAIAAAGLAAAELIAARTGARPHLTVDRRLASFWFLFSIRPTGWSIPPLWDPVAGDYATADGWIRLHTNAPHHRAVALRVLETPPDRAEVARAVLGWRKVALEDAIVDAGGCAAAMLTLDEWDAHPQGRAVAGEPLIARDEYAGGDSSPTAFSAERPLAGIRVLDLTRVLAGPVATRFLAGLGADVLRIDPPGWEEDAIAPEVTLGKHCARLDLHDVQMRETFARLLAGADVLVHGYRPGALDALGFGAEQRRAIRPGLVDVSLDAYGWSGPWRGRRGFDSLVQMSTGIAAAGMQRRGADRPVPLPAQALDHAAGYVMATAALLGLRERTQRGIGTQARTSLARVAELLVGGTPPDYGAQSAELAAETAADLAPENEATPWGAARRLKVPLSIDGVPLRWDLPPARLGADAPAWKRPRVDV